MPGRSGPPGSAAGQAGRHGHRREPIAEEDDRPRSSRRGPTSGDRGPARRTTSRDRPEARWPPPSRRPPPAPAPARRRAARRDRRGRRRRLPAQHRARRQDKSEVMTNHATEFRGCSHPASNTARRSLASRIDCRTGNAINNVWLAMTAGPVERLDCDPECRRPTCRPHRGDLRSMARRKNQPESVRVKCHLSERLRESASSCSGSAAARRWPGGSGCRSGPGTTTRRA